MLSKRKILKNMPSNQTIATKKALKFLNQESGRNKSVISALFGALLIVFGIFFFVNSLNMQNLLILINSTDDFEHDIIGFVIDQNSLSISNWSIAIGMISFIYSALNFPINDDVAWCNVTVQKFITTIDSQLSDLIIEYLKLYDKSFSYNSVLEALNNIAYSNLINDERYDGQNIFTKNTLTNQLKNISGQDSNYKT